MAARRSPRSANQSSQMCSCCRDDFSAGKGRFLETVGQILAPGPLLFELVARWIQLGDEGRRGKGNRHWHRARSARESACSGTLVKFP